MSDNRVLSVQYDEMRADIYDRATEWDLYPVGQQLRFFRSFEI